LKKNKQLNSELRKWGRYLKQLIKFVGFKSINVAIVFLS